MEVSSHIHGPVAVPQVKETGFGVAKNLLPLLEFEPRYVQPVARRYTDGAVLDTYHVLAKYKLCTFIRILTVETEDL